MKQAILSDELKVRYNEDNETYNIILHPSSVIILNRDEMSRLIDFAMETTKRKLAFWCDRCQPKQGFDSLKKLIDHAEDDHKIHLRIE